MLLNIPSANDGLENWDQVNSCIEPFIESLRVLSYHRIALRDKKRVLGLYIQWMQDKHFAMNDLNSSSVASFAQRPPLRSKYTTEFEERTIHIFLNFLFKKECTMWTCHNHDLSPVHKYLEDYIDYLQNQCGLANNSIKVYSFHVRNFLDWAEKNKNNTSDFLNAEMIHMYFTQKAPNQSKEQTRLSSVSLRSFFRYFFLKENTNIDFSKFVPTVKVWRQAQLPKFLTPEDVEILHLSIDLSTSKGRRDHAIFLLLARLGLRAGEIVSLELKDLCWRTGKIIIRGKGNIEEHLPLLSDIGEALACYIQTDRGKGCSQHVFLRNFAPRVALSGPAAIGHIVRKVMNQAGVHIIGRGAAHILRHSLATKMIRAGASMTEISQILRHQSLSTTAIYAKVDIEDLRGVAQEWPSVKGSDE